MKTLLAIDTSNQYCSVALQHQGVVTELHERAEQQHSEVILPMVRQILTQARLELTHVDAFVVGIGPGGFTGVRLAVAVIQGLAFSMNKSVVALSSLLAMAQAAYTGADCVVTVAMDARMQEVYHATYRVTATGCETLQAPNLSKLNDFIATQSQWSCISHYGVVGNAFTVFSELADWRVQHKVKLFEVDHESPHAANLLPAAQNSPQVLPEHVVPLYVRDKIAQTIVERAVK